MFTSEDMDFIFALPSPHQNALLSASACYDKNVGEYVKYIFIIIIFLIIVIINDK